MMSPRFFLLPLSICSTPRTSAASELGLQIAGGFSELREDQHFVPPHHGVIAQELNERSEFVVML